MQDLNHIAPSFSLIHKSGNGQIKQNRPLKVVVSPTGEGVDILKLKNKKNKKKYVCVSEKEID